MRRLRDVCAVALVLTPLISTIVCAQQASPLLPLVVDDVTVVDVVKGSLVPGQRVVIMGNRIRAVGKMGAGQPPAGARVIDARGKYMIPGLWDMHVHVWAYPHVFHPLFIANGVTGIRDMGTPIPLDTALQWRREINDGRRIGPRQMLAGNLIEGGTSENSWDLPEWGGYPGNIPVSTVERAQVVVDSLKRAGADFIKVHGGLTRDVLFALAAAARRVGLPIAGHDPSDGSDGEIPILQVIDSGQRSFEHIEQSKHFPAFKACWPQSSAMAAECKLLADRLARRNAWIVFAGLLTFGSPNRITEGELRAQVARYSLSRWLDTMPGLLRINSLPSTYLDGMRRAGIPIMAGTDVSPWTRTLIPGFSLHDELALMVEKGLTPLAALQSATLNPAKYLRATDSLGTIAAGMVADVVLLDANPLADIYNTRAIHAVVANGRYYDRARLDAVLAHVEQGGTQPWVRNAGP